MGGVDVLPAPPEKDEVMGAVMLTVYWRERSWFTAAKRHSQTIGVLRQVKCFLSQGLIFAASLLGEIPYFFSPSWGDFAKRWLAPCSGKASSMLCSTGTVS